jgi:hypothetical protein
MKKIFILVFLIIFFAILGFLLFEKEINVFPKVKPQKALQEFVEKTEKEIQEKNENNLSQSQINPQKLIENTVKKNKIEEKNEENSQVACEKIKKTEEALIKFKEFFLKLEIELEVKGEKEKKCDTIISANKLIELKKNNENAKKEDFEFLKNTLEGKKIEILIPKRVLFEILKKIENKEVLIF